MACFVLAQGMLFFAPGFLLWIFEFLFPKRQIKYLSEFKRDLGLAGIVCLFDTLLVLGFNEIASLPIFGSLQTAIAVSGGGIPWGWRLIFAYLLMDFSDYCIHCSLHDRSLLWKTHQFHHSFVHFWWLAGQRLSLIDSFFEKLPYLWFFIFTLPPEIMFFVVIHRSFHSVWQHLNIRGDRWMKIVELIYVTPRYHRVHHSTRQELQGCNMGVCLTCFDRIFGTYIDPEAINDREETCGLEENPPITTRLILGL